MISDPVQMQMKNQRHLFHLQMHEKSIPRGRERQMQPHFLVSQRSFLYGTHKIFTIRLNLTERILHSAYASLLIYCAKYPTEHQPRVVCLFLHQRWYFQGVLIRTDIEGSVEHLNGSEQ